MIIKVLHLYHDLMNLYGEYGNIAVLCRYLEDAGIEVQLDKVSVDDSFNITDYNFVYCGAGTERNQKVALADLISHKDELKIYIENNGTALFTGNSLEMLGKSICDRNGDTFEALSFADFYTYQGGESYKKYISANPNDTELIKNDTRITGDVIFKADFIEKPLVGFVNKCGFIKGNFTPLFNVVYGIGNNRNDKSDGIRINNILGTYLTGPILVKNPAMLDYVVSLITNGNAKNQSYDSQNRGYEMTYRELMKRFNTQG